MLNVEQVDWEPLPKPLVIVPGAGETVMPSSWCTAPPLEQSPGHGRDFYVSASGKEIYNEGHRRLWISNLDGAHTRQMTFQVAAVKKALGSLHAVVHKGNTIVFGVDDNGQDLAYIEHKESGERRWMRVEKRSARARHSFGTSWG